MANPTRERRRNGDAAVVCGLGTYLPPRRVSNHELAARGDTTDEWIQSRTGIRQRHWTEHGTATSDLAVHAGQRALASAGNSDIDMLVLATTTPDHPCPATAPEVASRLGLNPAAAFDIAAVCSGFIYALVLAANVITAGNARRVLVIGAEVYSTILNPQDPTTTAIFGDGAGAVVLTAGTPATPGAILGYDLGSDGTHSDLITIPAGGARQRSQPATPTPQQRYFTMRGREVFSKAVHSMKSSSTRVLNQVGWTPQHVDHLVGHQANVRILRSVADALGIQRHRAVINIDSVGNTAAASIPLALGHAHQQQRLHTGDRLLLTAFGGGLTWGSIALTWPQLHSA
ncbi:MULTISPECIES: beta-ketoacyl-ACP synthase III [unclassified Crossiella]|uniref:beta-ketoacyl-ACP synthase III n=1 Tax=unclassified Crossiella TaxID=2620835 RepID=UPI001FFEF46D|nr:MULTISPECIES: beta-ketoacyl-ACP synthase III [unclassified Crossiella]MCK2240020.1 ketoacyl-ACP synthase III [Crossiella sp. S99.2]MCK2252728.1 ketoacyl-ACP synthase III [Crossiella sp. S99.1]